MDQYLRHHLTAEKALQQLSFPRFSKKSPREDRFNTVFLDLDWFRRSEGDPMLGETIKLGLTECFTGAVELPEVVRGMKAGMLAIFKARLIKEGL